MEKSAKIGKTIYIEFDLWKKVRDFAESESISFNKALELLISDADFDKIKDNWF